MPRIDGMPATPGSVTPTAHDDEVANGAAPGASSRAPFPAQLAPYRPKREPVQNGAYRDQLRQRPLPKPQLATVDIQKIVPPNGSGGTGVFNAIRNALGSGQKGFTALNLASKKPLTGVLGADSRAAGSGFAHDVHTGTRFPA
ncbi:hypothetical protein PQQ86_32700 [Paraburkholderia sediminicola]|uniref:hypothetical protein n=1 Tax=Paraburkholderia sediminicola TaxID=458836 RepID=UPI0038BD17EA